VAKYAFDHGLTKNNPMRVRDGAGVLTLDLVTNNGKVELVTVNMGQPHLELERVAVDGGKVIKTGIGMSTRCPAAGRSARQRAGDGDVREHRATHTG
jgi:diaminopimelate epimerase